MEWENYSSIYSSSEAEVFGAGTILPTSVTLWFYICREPPRWCLTTRGLANSLPSAGTQELRHKATWNSSERSSQDASSHCCPGLPVPFFLEETHTLKKRLQQRRILLPHVFIKDCFKPSIALATQQQHVAAQMVLEHLLKRQRLLGIVSKNTGTCTNLSCHLPTHLAENYSSL